MISVERSMVIFSAKVSLAYSISRLTHVFDCSNIFWISSTIFSLIVQRMGDATPASIFIAGGV